MEPEIKLNLNSIIREWALQSSSHGIPNIARAGKISFLKFLWTICFLISLSYSLYLVSESLIEFTSRPYITSQSLIEETPTQFPTVLICSLNALNNKNTQVLKLAELLEKQFESLQLKNFNGIYSDIMSTAFKSFLIDLPDSAKKSAGYQLKDMLISCYFNNVECNVTDFKWIFVFDYVNCYAFNAKGNKFSGHDGFYYGLKLELYIENGNSSRHGLYSMSRGLRYMIYNYTVVTPFIFDLGYDAAPGQVTNVQIKKSQIQKLGNPYNECIMDLTPSSAERTYLMNIMFDHLNQTKYNQLYCQNLCLNEAYVKYCNCYQVTIDKQKLKFFIFNIKLIFNF